MYKKLRQGEDFYSIGVSRKTPQSDTVAHDLKHDQRAFIPREGAFLAACRGASTLTTGHKRAHLIRQCSLRKEIPRRSKSALIYAPHAQSAAGSFNCYAGPGAEPLIPDSLGKAILFASAGPGLIQIFSFRAGDYGLPRRKAQIERLSLRQDQQFRMSREAIAAPLLKHIR